MNTSSVLKIYASSQAPDYDCPWQSLSPNSSSGSGVMIEKGLILTAAHVVADHTFLQVQKKSSTEKEIAEVVAIHDESDLALLRVRNASFCKDIPAMQIGELPDLQDKVSVCGFPIGGDEISITEGVVSRIEVQCYTHSSRHLLAVTVDAAINSGNSGGPVIKKGKIVGIAFQALEEAENIGEIVPSPVIKHFLQSVQQGKNPSIPALGLKVQHLENPTLRKKIGMSSKDSGILVTSVLYGNSCHGVLQKGDVLLALNQNKISNNGTALFEKKHRTQFSALLQGCFLGDIVMLDVLRNKEYLSLPMELKPLQHLVPRNQYNLRPSYFVFGGLVFQKLTKDYMKTWGNWKKYAPNDFVRLYKEGQPSPHCLEIVVLSQVLADRINVSYEAFANEIIETVNGVQPIDLKHFVQLMTSAKKDVVLQTHFGNTMVLNIKDVQDSNSSILERYHVVSDRSKDLVL